MWGVTVETSCKKSGGSASSCIRSIRVLNLCYFLCREPLLHFHKVLQTVFVVLLLFALPVQLLLDP